MNDLPRTELYRLAKREQAKLYAAVDSASKALNAFPKIRLGLTPDDIKATPEWKAARKAYDDTFARLRTFNAAFVPAFKAEIRADRANSRRGAR